MAQQTSMATARPLEQLSVDQEGKGFELFTPSEYELMELAEIFYSDVEESAPPTIVRAMMAHNPDVLLAFRNTTTGALGFVAILPLTTAGHIALADGRLDTVDPEKYYICGPEDKPHSVYVWGIGVSPKTTGGLAHIMEFLSAPHFQDCTLYCSAANQKAERLFFKLGFTKGAMINGSWRPDLMEFARGEEELAPTKDTARHNAKRPNYDSYDPVVAKPSSIGIKLVHTSEELMQVFMIRGAAYMGEQGVPWREDVDGNDYCGAHLIGYVGTEPAACLRLRFFANFVKLERLAVLPHFRKSSVAARIVRAGIDYSRNKGYTRFYGHSELETSAIWRRFGFVQRNEDSLQYQTERKYYEGDMITDSVDDAINPSSGPFVLLRPEGQWHMPSELEPAE